MVNTVPMTYDVFKKAPRSKAGIIFFLANFCKLKEWQKLTKGNLPMDKTLVSAWCTALVAGLSVRS